MSAMPAMLAQLMSLEGALAGWRRISPGTRDILIVLAVTGVVAAGVWIVVWVGFFRTPRRHHHRHRHGHHHGRHREHESSPEPAVDAAATNSEDDPSRQHRRKRRHRRREHRPLNPTLAETGGLPPVRTGEPPEIKP